VGLGSSLIGALGGGKRKTEPAVPGDVQGLRGSQIGFLQSLFSQQQGAGGGNSPLFQQFFGNLGSPATGLQQQASGSISQFLNQQSPEARALQSSLPSLEGILGSARGSVQPCYIRYVAR